MTTSAPCACARRAHILTAACGLQTGRTLGANPAPSNAVMLDLLLAWAPDETARSKILVDNPARLYGF